LKRRSAVGETVLAFPATTAVLFAAELTSPVEHDYWYPGRPDHDDEAAMLDKIARQQPARVVTLNRGWTFFLDSPAYFAATRDFVRSHYRLAARFGRFDVLVRNDLAGEAVENWQPLGPREALSEGASFARRQAAARWQAQVSPEQASRARLPSDRIKARLWLRAIRDVPDVRASAWLVAGYESGDAALRAEAVSAMVSVSYAFEAARNRWAGDFDPRSRSPWVTHLKDWAEGALIDSSDRVRWFASTIIFILDPRREPQRPLEFARRASN